MKDRILELAREHGFKNIGIIPGIFEFIQAVHQDGQRAMQERAAKECEDCTYTDTAARHIRNLEIQND